MLLCNTSLIALVHASRSRSVWMEDELDLIVVHLRLDFKRVSVAEYHI